jgi:hypothetical protein
MKKYYLDILTNKYADFNGMRVLKKIISGGLTQN